MAQSSRISRRAALALGAGATAAFALHPAGAFAAEDGFGHAYSPLGAIKYPPGFRSFDYVNVNAPKGGTMRLARIGAFDTANTLTYPGLPPADVRVIYDRLIVASADERASYYGMLARGLQVSDDFTRIAFLLHPDARWHDGRPLRAQDVQFTFDMLKAEGAPFYRQAFRPLSVIAESETRVVFVNERVDDRDVLRRIATIPIHPAHFWESPAEIAESRIPLGSGPYRIASIDAPRRLVLERVPDYWGEDLPVNRGRWNPDTLVFDYFRDASVALQAFKADDYDIRFEDNPTRWQTGYSGPAVSSGAIQRSETPDRVVGALHGVVFNMRRPFLSDRRVRMALSLAYDFDAVNRTLFGGALQPFESVFGETQLAAEGPASGEEASLIRAAGGPLPTAVLETPDPLGGLPQPGSREALSEATRLFNEAGYTYADGRLTDPESGRAIELRLISPNPLYDRPLTWLDRAWERIGIRLIRVQADPASASRQMLDRDFDLATLSWSPAPLPGTAERLLWHSDLASQDGSYALSGIRDPALDSAIEALEKARTMDALRTAAHAFDRVFRQLMPMLPLWRSNTIRLAWWDRFGRPEAERSGFPPSPLDRWWIE